MTSESRERSAEVSEEGVSRERGALEAYPDLRFELSSGGRILAYQEGVETPLYTEPENFLGRRVGEVLPEQAARKVIRGLEELDRGVDRVTVNYTLPIGEALRLFEARILALSSGNRLAVIRDMTDEWRAKSALEESEAKFRALVQNIPGMVYRCEAEFDWPATYVSPQVEAIVGFPPEEFESGERTLGSVIHPEDRAGVAAEVERCVVAREPFSLNYRIITADGEIRYIHEQGRALYSPEGEPEYLDGAIFDVTDMHRMRQRLLEDQKMAAVGNLAAGVAHEINNPLAVILSNLEYAVEELGAIRGAFQGDATVEEALDDVMNAVERVRSSTDRVRGIIDDMRTFSDAAIGEVSRLNLGRVVTWAVQRFESRTSGEKVERDLQEVPQVWAGEASVAQVVWNLLENAHEAVQGLSPEERRVAIGLRPVGNEVLLTVEDNGEGMSPDVEARAFEPFYTTREVGQGTGLGLFVCQGLVEAMNGAIELETAPGQGTTVRVRLPAAEDAHNH